MGIFQHWQVRQTLRLGGATLGLGLLQYQLGQGVQGLMAPPQRDLGPEMAAVGLSLGVSTGAVLCHRWLRKLEPSWTFRRFITLFALVNGLFFALFAGFFLGPTAAELVLLGPLLTFMVAITPTGIIAAILKRYAAIELDGPSIALLFCGFNLLVWVGLLGLVAPLTALGLGSGWLALGLTVVAAGFLPWVLGVAAIANLTRTLGAILATSRDLDASATEILAQALATTLQTLGPGIGFTTILMLGINHQLGTRTDPLIQPLQDLAQHIQAWGRIDQ